MISKDEYLSQTEHAVKTLFECMNNYSTRFKRSIPPTRALSYSTEAEFQANYFAWRNQPDVVESFKLAEQAREEYRGQLFSQHVISGSILQIACKAIELFSENEKIDEKYQHLFQDFSNNKQRLVRQPNTFGFGREVRGVPLALVILAGRNQYNHLDKGADLNQLNVNIFNALARNHDYGRDILDPAFELDNNDLVSYSSNVMSIIGWHKFEDYILDIKTLLP